jgi:hypothetical protein
MTLPAAIPFTVELTPQEARALTFAAELLIDTIASQHRPPVSQETLIVAQDKLRYALLENGQELR